MKEIEEYDKYIKSDRILIPIHIENKDIYIKEFECPICQNLLCDPQDCIRCDQSYCKQCIEDYIGNDNSKN